MTALSSQAIRPAGQRAANGKGGGPDVSPGVAKGGGPGALWRQREVVRRTAWLRRRGLSERVRAALTSFGDIAAKGWTLRQVFDSLAAKGIDVRADAASRQLAKTALQALRRI